MPFAWFRLYRETITDPKFSRMPGGQRHLWTVLLCLADDDGRVAMADGVPYESAELAVIAGIEPGDAVDALCWYTRLKMIRVNKSGIVINNWNKRQFKSDNSTERVRKHREKRDGNVSVAPPDTDTDTEQTQKKHTPSKFTPPAVDDVRTYATERHYTFDPEAFVAHYTANGWRVGRNPMKSWQAACVTWQKREPPSKQPAPTTFPWHDDDVKKYGSPGSEHPRWDEYMDVHMNMQNPPEKWPRFEEWLA